MTTNQPKSQSMGEVVDELITASRCALADLEGIMPEFEPSGDRTHSAWKTIRELHIALSKFAN